MSRSVRLLAVSPTLATSAALLGAAGATAAPAFSTATQLDHRGQIAVRGNTTVLTQIAAASSAQRGSADVWIGKGGNLPERVAAITGVPEWAQPHVGTDAARNPVVVYPSCSDVADVKTCDLKQYEVPSGKISTVPGVNTSSAGETEGASDRGAVVAVRWTSATDPVAASLGGQGKTPATLVYRAAGASSARALTTKGGQQVALDRGRVAFVREGNATGGTCGLSLVQVIRVSGGPVKTLAKHTCGMGMQAVTLPTFVGSELVYGLRGLEGQTLHRIPVNGGRNASAKVKVAFAQFAATSRTGGYYTDGLWFSEPEPGSTDDQWSYGKAIGLSFGQ